MPDDKIQIAIQNWLPRFIAQGVEYHDFARTTARIQSWDDWCREWCKTGDEHMQRARQAESKERSTTAGDAYVAAALSYHFGKFLFQERHDEYMAASLTCVQAYSCGLGWLDPGAERIEIPFEDSNLVGILRFPSFSLNERKQRTPLVLLLPGLDSCKEEFFYWEQVFHRRGLATFSLDGPGQGESAQHFPIRHDYESAGAATLNVLARRDDIDTKRLAVAGVSLGGYYTARAMAYEPRLRAGVAIAGPYDWSECWENLNALTRAAFQYHSGARDESDAMLKARQLTLVGAAQKIKQPMLIIHGKLDKLVPWQQAQRIADAVGASAELVLYENGNHVCNNVPNLYRPLAADWVAEKLG
jgi:dienelactone hydrolase